MRFSPFILILLTLIAPTAAAKVNIFACEPEWKALSDAIGGDHVNTFSATNAYQDPHYIEARPSLIAKARNTDMLVCTGADLEIGWLPLLLRQSGNSKIQENQPGYFLAALQVERIDVPTKLDRSQGDVHALGNPHVHWDPYRLLTIAKAFTQRLETIDPDHAQHYQQNYQRFSSNWQSAIKEWEDQAKPLQGKKVIVYHKSWNYLLNWLGIKVIGDLEPKPGIPPSSSHLAKLLNSVRQNKPDFILISNFQDEKGARWLSKKANIPVIKLPFTVGGSDKATDLLSLYSEVITLLVES